uniref:Zinc finger CCHC domain-containing protein 8 (Trinotate prediction) n=1 Tax=Henneguya salminicola TaxID=69463 RepID=A0A6G3MFL7_HENSL
MFDYDLPPYIYKMRVLGYPPGYLPKYNIDTSISIIGSSEFNHVSSDSNVNNAEDVVIYPGFNAPVPTGVIDTSHKYGYPRINPKYFVPPKINLKTLNIPEPEDVIRLNITSVEVHARGYYFDPLSVNIFPSKRFWRSPPLLNENVIFENVNNLMQTCVDVNSEPFEDEQIPTNRLERIINYLRKDKKNNNL